MQSFVVRVWLPDRPGALGAVASRIGTVRGDVVGIEILERGGGIAVDELVVQLPDARLLPLLLREIGEVDGVDVEDVRPAAEHMLDPCLDALQTAIVLTSSGSLAQLAAALVAEVRRGLDAAWAAVVEPETVLVLAAQGPCPDGSWLAAFAAGGSSSQAVVAGRFGPDDVAWALLPKTSLALMAGRPGLPFRARERRRLIALATIADLRGVALAPVPPLKRRREPATPAAAASISPP